MDIREYHYDRRRVGGGLDVEYKLGPNSRLWARSRFSQFDDGGHRYQHQVATPNTQISQTYDGNYHVGGEHQLQTGDLM